MKRLLILSLLTTPLLVQAAIYRWVDSEGVLHFSDQKPDMPGVEEVNVKPPNVVGKEGSGEQAQMPRKKTSTGSAAKNQPLAVPPRYNSLTIVSPANDAAVRANNGVVTVSCQLDPPLGTKAGHSIQIIVDGRTIRGLSRCGTALSELARGTHSLQIQVVDSLGKVLISSPVQTFHVLRTSRL